MLKNVGASDLRIGAAASFPTVSNIDLFTLAILRTLSSRARLPSLYSDFQSQRYSNPDGFVANCTAWIDALSRATWAEVSTQPAAGHDLLSITVGKDLLQALETKDYGQPLALGTVIVGTYVLMLSC